MACLFQLSLARLDLTLNPYRFHNRNHLLLSIAYFSIDIGVPILLDVLSTLWTGSSCGSIAQFAMSALYGDKIAGQQGIMSFPIVTVLNVFVNIVIGLCYFCKRRRNAVGPRSNLQASRMIFTWAKDFTLLTDLFCSFYLHSLFRFFDKFFARVLASF